MALEGVATSAVGDNKHRMLTRPFGRPQGMNVNVFCEPALMCSVRGLVEHVGCEAQDSSISPPSSKTHRSPYHPHRLQSERAHLGMRLPSFGREARGVGHACSSWIGLMVVPKFSSKSRGLTVKSGWLDISPPWLAERLSLLLMIQEAASRHTSSKGTPAMTSGGGGGNGSWMRAAKDVDSTGYGRHEGEDSEAVSRSSPG